MKFKIEIECDNAAFEDGLAESEVSRILREVRLKLEYYKLTSLDGHKLYDINGNHVGKITTYD